MTTYRTPFGPLKPGMYTVTAKFPRGLYVTENGVILLQKLGAADEPTRLWRDVTHVDYRFTGTTVTAVETPLPQRVRVAADILDLLDARLHPRREPGTAPVGYSTPTLRAVADAFEREDTLAAAAAPTPIQATP